MRTMRRPYQIAGTMLLLFSAFMGWQSLKLRYYTELGPGPGFFPFWLSILMGSVSAFMVLQATLTGSGLMPKGFFASRAGYLRAVAVLSAIAVSALLIENAGYRTTMTVFLLFLMFALGRVYWLVSLVVSVVAGLGTFWLFDSVLKVPLPIGPFGF